MDCIDPKDATPTAFRRDTAKIDCRESSVIPWKGRLIQMFSQLNRRNWSRAWVPLRSLWLMICLLLLVQAFGCAYCGSWCKNCFKVGPDYFKPAAPVADSWIDFNDPRVISDPANDRQWWTAFNDPAIDSLVQSAYRGNLPLRAQGQKVLEYRALRAMSVGNLFPQAQALDGFYKRVQISENGNIGGVTLPERSFDLWNIGPGIQWELDVWGRFRRRIEQVTAELDQQVELYDDVLSIVVADTAQAYANLRTAQEFVRLARQNVEIQQGSLKLAETRFNEGAVGELDVTQARSTLRETEALIPQFEIFLRKTNNELCVLMGTPPRDLTKEFGEGPIPVAPTSVALGIPAELMRRRPDIRAAERAVASSSAEIGVAVSDLYPHFFIDGAFSYTSNDVTNLFTGQSVGGVIGPSFRWDILNYGRINNNVRRQDARFQQAAINYQQTVLKANKEVEDALTSFLKSQERAKQLQDAVEATQKSVNLALIEYREGAIDFERVFNLQNVLVRQQIDQAKARAEITLSLIEVYRALRGGWQIRLEQPGPMEIVTASPEGVELLPATEDLPPPQQ
jgi:NodT family efflux transporter outer membrane factor (OMF) lipoprotein